MLGAVCHFKCYRLHQQLRLFLTGDSQRCRLVKNSFHRELYEIIQSSHVALNTRHFNTVFPGLKLKFKDFCSLLYMHMDEYEQARVGSRTCFHPRCQISSVCIPLLLLLSPLWWKKKTPQLPSHTHKLIATICLSHKHRCENKQSLDW